MLQYSIMHKIILIQVHGLPLNLICCNTLNLSTMIRKAMRWWIISINGPLIYKSTSAYFWNYCLDAKYIYQKRKHYNILKLVFSMKIKFKFKYSSLQTWKLHVKFLIGLVASHSIHQATEMTNANEKANAATKMIWIIQIASISHTNDAKNHRTWKNQVLWN